MKKMSDVFDFPVNVRDLEIYGKSTGSSSFEECEVHAAHAINHVDALAEALALMTDLALIKWGNLDAEVYAEIEKAKAALVAYRGEA